MPRIIPNSFLVFSLCVAAAAQTALVPPAPAPASPASEEARPEVVKPDSTPQPAPAVSSTPAINPQAAGPATPPPASPVPADKAAYVIGPEDSLYIRVWHEPDLSGTLDVRPDGYISMQLIGEIKADGLTVAQLGNVVAKRLTDFIKTPEVNVQLLKVNSKKYSIQGEVNRPGTYALTGPTTVLEALVNASGFRDFANTKKIYVLRGSQRFPFNYKAVSKGKSMDENIQIQNGDQIFVP